ncbi:IS1595 family transposase [endosymbiont GvMRE of Glomus versiforme]|uniref:IS1595 family transposase n=1 Tax=endosymbiont GvMRE of Glomus versiforme TaxID=2039283 RepID=UPI000EED6B30|nr:IS1595 family transposase [endosymbiont GvMRE of Glomus versiforme]RHZ37305.1 Transposase [endosymbiont GvMRE of Glomus versiforme]RHZ37488.1 Transposase [endosymbiont GvMRE of Glomus versiforme]
MLLKQNFKSLLDLLITLPTEQNCIDYLEAIIWNSQPISPFDPNSKVYKCADNKYKCKNTNKYFTIKTGTVFRNSKIPLQKWLWALYIFSAHKKGISSCQLAKDISITQKSAWFMLHRLRSTFKISELETMLKDLVEIDETFIGGKNKNRHWNKKVPHSQGRSWTDKIPVLGLLERGGNLITQVVFDTRQNTLEPIIRANIEKGSDVYTDEWYRHSSLSQSFNHQIVNHSAKQYVKGTTSTNAIENFWSHLKRGINGIYHWISKKHTSKYVNEFTLRFNTRKYQERERFDLILSSVVGKNLTYQKLIN